MSEPKRYYGKYRGTVMNNVDPEQRARILVSVPDADGIGPPAWAMPAVPVAGKQMGVFLVPPIGASVWIEFEQGDPNLPVWTGGFWASSAEVPAPAALGLPISPSMVLQTSAQNTIAISDAPGPSGGIMLRTSTGAMILVSDAGITIANGKGASITLTGPTISLNDGAMEIT
ncbi:MAG: phage baseplate assembly protein V [Bryobacteraceae bacterium]